MIDFKRLPKRQISDSFKQKEFADDNFFFDENGGKFSERIENTVGKEEIAHYEQFLLFTQCFQKTCIAVTLQEGHDGPVSLHWLILGNLFKN